MKGKIALAPQDWDGKTTVMIRNIPNLYTQRTLLNEVCRRGFTGCYDFLYLPMDFAKSSNSGYAFANFNDAETVTRFRQEFDGQRLDLAPGSAKLIQVVPATLQGYDANYHHFAHSAVFNHHRSEHAPVFLRGGSKVVTRSPAARRLPVKRTLAISKVPQTYTHAMLTLELCAYGCGPSVEVLDFDEHWGTAYAVFATEEAADHAALLLEGRPFTLAPGSEIKIERVSRREKPASPPRMAFEYAVPAASPASLLAAPEVPEVSPLDGLTWESFCAPHLTFSPEVMAAYAALLYNAPPIEESLKAFAAIPALEPEEKPLQARETLASRFQGLGISAEEDDSWQDAVTPYSTAAFLGCSTPCTETGPTPLMDNRKVSIGEDKASLEKRARSLSGPITPPTTTAGSSQNTSPARTPRQESVDYNAFDLPCLLPAPGFGW
jgi:hypothetical protein